MTNEEKQYCVNNLVSLVIIDLGLKYPKKSKTDLLSEFLGSNTYSLMCDYKTELWKEGPGYILDMYIEEKGLK